MGWLSAVPRGSGPVARGRRLRTGGLLAGGTAAVVIGIVGCTNVTGGTAAVDAKDVPAYRTSVAASASASAATSSARESERLQSVTTEAVHSTCEALSTSSADAIDTVNAYVSAFNEGGGDVAATEGPAVDALNKSADSVAASMTPALPQPLSDALNAWVDAARAVAKAITGHASPGEFNNVINQLNDTRSNSLRLCDAAY
jgi:hypothetical protein